MLTGFSKGFLPVSVCIFEQMEGLLYVTGFELVSFVSLGRLVFFDCLSLLPTTPPGRFYSPSFPLLELMVPEGDPFSAYVFYFFAFGNNRRGPLFPDHTLPPPFLSPKCLKIVGPFVIDPI